MQNSSSLTSPVAIFNKSYNHSASELVPRKSQIATRSWLLQKIAKQFSKSCEADLRIELLLITPFTNAKVKRLVSWMSRIKTLLRNRLSTQRLEAQLRIGEEGCPLADYKAEDSMEYWLNQKIRCMNGAKPRNYPENRQSAAASNSNIIVYWHRGSDFVRPGRRRRKWGMRWIVK